MAARKKSATSAKRAKAASVQADAPAVDAGSMAELPSAGVAPEDASAQDWAVAEAARPSFADETVDGLSDLEEEVRHAAEDLPDDEPWEVRVRRKAYELWESEGGPHGRDEDHWRIAAELVAAEVAERRGDLPYAGTTEETVEEAALLDNLGEAPAITDQGEAEAEPAVQPSTGRRKRGSRAKAAGS